MSNHSTVLRHWIERLNAGDKTQSIRELLKHSEERFRVLAHDRLNKFQQLRPFVDTGDVLADAQIKFAKAMRKVRFNTVDHFLSVGANKIRQHLLDLKRKFFGPHGDGRRQTRLDPDGPEPVDGAAAAAVAQIDVDEALDRLSADHRQAIELCYYQGLSMADAARVLNLAASTFRRRLDEAKAALGASFRTESANFPARQPVG